MILKMPFLHRDRLRWRFPELRAVLVTICLFQLSGCMTYVGDDLIRTVDLVAGGYDDRDILNVQDYVTNLVHRLDLPADIKERLKSVAPKEVIHWSSDRPLYKADNRLIVITGNSNLLEVSNSIIVSKRSIYLVHSSNNIVISMEDINIGTDGGKRLSVKGEKWQAFGSLVVAKGKVKGTGIWGTQIFAGRGVSCSHCGNIRIYSKNDNKNLWADLDA